MLDLWENVLYIKNSKVPVVEDISPFKINMKTAYLIIMSIYKRFSEDQIQKIYHKISSMNESFYYVLVHNSKIMNFKTKEQYISHYKSKITAFNCLTSGIAETDLVV